MCLLKRLFFRDMFFTGVQTFREWKIYKTGAGISQHFFTEYYQGQKNREPEVY